MFKKVDRSQLHKTPKQKLYKLIITVNTTRVISGVHHAASVKRLRVTTGRVCSLLLMLATFYRQTSGVQVKMYPRTKI